MSKMRICFLAAVAAAGIGLGGTFGASAVPMNGNLVGAEPTAVATTAAITVATTLVTTVATTVVISNVVLVA
jgi:hypothetical protein